MADVEWPASYLPLYPATGWTEKPGEATIRTKTDAGPAKLRRRFTSAPTQFSMQFNLATDATYTAQQKATRMVEFYSNAPDGAPYGTAGGSRTFGTLPNPRDNSSATWRFMGSPVITQIAPDLFRASLRLEMLVA